MNFYSSLEISDCSNDFRFVSSVWMSYTFCYNKMLTLANILLKLSGFTPLIMIFCMLRYSSKQKWLRFLSASSMLSILFLISSLFAERSYQISVYDRTLAPMILERLSAPYADCIFGFIIAIFWNATIFTILWFFIIYRTENKP